MQLAFTVTAILLAFVYPVQSHRYSKDQNDNSTTCKHPTAVEAFAASFYTALIVTRQDQDDVHGLKLPGKEAADRLFPIIADLLKAQGLCDADMVAWTASRAVAMEKTLKLTKYFKLTAYNVGDFLQKKGLLDCKNAVSLALDYFKLVREELEDLPVGKFESYMQGIVYGLLDFIQEHNLDLSVVAQQLADIFYQEFSTNNHEKCELSKGSN